MSENERIALIRLRLIPGLGPVRIKKLVRVAGSPTAVFSDQVTAWGKRIPAQIRSALNLESYLKTAETLYNRSLKAGLQCIAYTEDEYPENLRHCVDSPVILYAKGTMDLSRGPLLSIVGTRRMTSYGKAFCKEFIRELSRYRPIIISGYAYGIDIFAQRTAMEHGLQTIACMAHGLDRVYPEVHRKYVQAVMENGGFFSEFDVGVAPEPQQFVRRNRLIAGLSRATVVVESPLSGGSLITADLAFGYNREVFAVPGRTKDAMSEGCNRLIFDNKAHLLQTAGDLAEVMGWQASGTAQTQPTTQIALPLEGTDQLLADFLRRHPGAHLDDIALGCGVGIPEVSASLFRLEMQGCLEALQGKKYRWIV